MSVFCNSLIIGQEISGFIEPGRNHLKTGICQRTSYLTAADMTICDGNDAFISGCQILQNDFIIRSERLSEKFNQYFVRL